VEGGEYFAVMLSAVKAYISKATCLCWWWTYRKHECPEVG